MHTSPRTLLDRLLSGGVRPVAPTTTFTESAENELLGAFVRGLCGSSRELGEPPEIPGYTLGRLLGRGGAARVYGATRLVDGRRFAMKIVRGSSPESHGRVRAVREAELLGSLRHPHLIELVGFGQVEGATYLVLSRIEEGRSFEEHVRLASRSAARARAIARGVPLLAQAARALQALHEVGIVHRDVKPANILVRTTDSGDEHAAVTDLGIAHRIGDPRSTDGSCFVGTRAFVAPEQAAGRVEPSADVFGLGACLYELLTGRTTPAVPTGDLADPSARFDLSRLPRSRSIAPLSRLAARALDGSIDRRPESSRAFAETLEAWGLDAIGARPALGPVAGAEDCE